MKVPQTRIELVREYKSRRILSPVRLPVPPLRHFACSVYNVGIRASTVPSNLLTQWAMVDSNHRRRCQQIYSLSPLATREIAHIALKQINYITTCRNCKHFFLYFPFVYEGHGSGDAAHDRK